LLILAIYLNNRKTINKCFLEVCELEKTMALTKQTPSNVHATWNIKTSIWSSSVDLKVNKHNNISKNRGKNECSKHVTTKLQGGVEWRLGGFSLKKQIKSTKLFSFMLFLKLLIFCFLDDDWYSACGQDST
jgi:hypothetical protein